MTEISRYKLGNKDSLLILLIFILALIPRLIYFAEYINTDIYPVLTQSDSYSYYIWARDINSGQVLPKNAFMKWPLYAYFLAFLFKIFGHNFSYIYSLQFAWGAANCCLIYIIAGILFNRTVAFIAALLCACYGLFVFYDGLLMYTTLSLFLNSLFFICILNIKDNPTSKNLFWIGIFFGISIITQASIAIFGVLAIIWILINKRLNWKKLIYNFSSFAIGVFMIVGSVTLVNYLAERNFVLLSGNLGLNFYLGNNQYTDGRYFCPEFLSPNQEDMFKDAQIIAKVEKGRDLKTSEVSIFWFNKGREFILQNPFTYLKLLLKKIGFIYNPREYVHDAEYSFIKDEIKIFKILFMDLRIILPFAFLGIFSGFRKFKQTALLYIMLIAVSFSMCIFFVATRYRLTMVPFLMIFAAFGIFILWHTLRNGKYLKFTAFFFVLAVFFILSKTNDNLSTSRQHLHKAMYREENGEYKNALAELKLAAKLEPNNLHVIFHMGVMYYHLENFAEAENSFKKAIQISPLYVKAYYNLGHIYNKQGRYYEALDMLKKTIALDPENISAHFELGMTYKAFEEYANAKEEFIFALENLSPWREEDYSIIKEELNSTPP